MNNKLRLAILDMNNGQANQGMRCIKDIVSGYAKDIEFEVFDVRAKHEIADLSFDIYISSGGPGNPLEGDGIWDKAFYGLINDIWEHNKYSFGPKKYMFFICHSFQMACLHFGLGKVTKRKSTSFGVQPVHKTKDGKNDFLLQGLKDPYYVVESRDWQVVQPNIHVFHEHDCKILSLEKIRTHVQFERAIMAVRFSEEFVGTQYHPEADAEGMLIHFEKEENRAKVIKNFGEEKYASMMDHLDDEDKIMMTHKVILPTFIDHAIKKIKSFQMVLV